MSRRRRAEDETPGQDSFLDIVANLVGIMIILVIVIGVRAKGEMGRAAPTLNIQAEPDVETARSTAAVIEESIRRIQGGMGRYATEIKYRRLERDKLLLMTTALEAEMKKKRDALDADAQKLYDKNQQITLAQAELEKLARKATALDRDIEQVEVLQHLPTPMAKTVFGKEVQFRLLEGQLTYVPWNELVERLKTDVKQNAWKLKNSESITETLGPVRNFMMRYTVDRRSFTTETRMGAATQERIELDSFELFAVEERGESVDAALHEDSEFNSILASFQPARTTVTIWVYPDSFDDYRKLQSALYRRGFLTAARPMPKDAPIGGSPKGTRTNAQ